MKAALLDTTNRPNIALIDDDPAVTDAYSLILTEQYQVTIFNRPEEFLKYLDFHDLCPFDVVITDLRMPTMGGLQLAQKARKKGFEFSTLLFSAYLDKADILKAVNSGIMKVIEKSAGVETILQCLDELVLENRIRRNQMQIRDLVLKLRESYQHLQLLVGDYLDEKIREGAGSQPPVDNIEDLLSSLEARMDRLLAEGQQLAIRRQQYWKAA